MAASPSSFLTLDQFDQIYGDEKPYHEYWDGEAIQKPMPTLLHSYLQMILVTLLRRIGLAAAGEVRIKLSQTKQPLPYVIAGKRLQHPYPTKPFLVAVEILSPTDSMQRVLRKLRFYAEQGISYIYVFDPEDRTAQRWNSENESLGTIDSLQIESRPRIDVLEIWKALDVELQQVDFTAPEA